MKHNRSTAYNDMQSRRFAEYRSLGLFHSDATSSGSSDRAREKVFNVPLVVDCIYTECADRKYSVCVYVEYNVIARAYRAKVS